MSSDSLVLPKNVFEKDMADFLTQISSVENIDVDISNIEYYSPASIVALLCALEKSRSENPRKIIYKPDSGGFRYFQRMDFFKHLAPNLKIPEDFTRRVPVNFSPIIRIDRNSSEKDIAKAITSTVFGDGIFNEREKFNLEMAIQYAVGEIVRNVIQHSESYGYIASQYYPKTGLVRIGIADSGIGILESFKKNASPFYNSDDTHLTMIQKALKREVSSKTHKPLPPYSSEHENKGVGLTMLASITSLTYGYFLLASGDAYSFKDGDTTPIEKNFDGFYQGTVCSIVLNRNQLDKYPYDMLRKDAFNKTMGISDIDEEDLFS